VGPEVGGIHCVCGYMGSKSRWYLLDMKWTLRPVDFRTRPCMFQYATSPERHVISDLSGESTCGPGCYVAGHMVWRRCSVLPFNRDHHVVQHRSTFVKLFTLEWVWCSDSHSCKRRREMSLRTSCWL
jgi:hypothetical protein